MTTVLDDVLPVYRHRERHATQIAAAPEVVWRALHTVSGGDLRLTRLLMSIRAVPGRLRPAGRPAVYRLTAASSKPSSRTASASCVSIRRGPSWRAPRDNPGDCTARSPSTS